MTQHRVNSRNVDLQGVETVLDLEPLFRAKVRPDFYDFVAGGAGGENTIRMNREALQRRALVTGGGLQPDSVDPATSLLGHQMPFPILVGPMSAHGNLHPGGSAETFRGASAAGAQMILSAFNDPYEEISPAARDPLWFQFYPEMMRRQDRITRPLELGCPVVVLTVDSPYASDIYRVRRTDISERDWGLLDRVKEPLRDARDQFVREVDRTPDNPYRLRPRSAQADWSIVERLRSFIDVPIVIKGLQTAEDARLAVEYGVDAIVVSNHGGRVLDFATPTITSLPEIVAAVQGRIPVMIDSGFRSGQDVLTALALGADAVLIGRPVLWGLGAAGATGVQRAMNILQTELVQAMADAGCTSLIDVDESILQGDRT